MARGLTQPESRLRLGTARSYASYTAADPENETVAVMSITELEACLKETLNPRMPLDVLHAALARLRSLEAAERPP